MFLRIDSVAEESCSGQAPRGVFQPIGEPGFLAEFILSGKSKILRAAQNDSEGLEMTKLAIPDFLRDNHY
jgi:hypothetical protein